MKKRLIGVLMLVMMILTIITPPQLSQAATVKISKKKATMEVDSVLTLKISGTDSKVTWKSSAKKIAKVSSKGKVTALKEGTATITATVNSKKYTCVVTVVDSNKETVEPTLTPEPTPTPDPEKKIVDVDITPDNWLDYFEIVHKEIWSYNAFDEFSGFYIKTSIVLKDEYAKRLAKDSSIKFEISYVVGNISASINPVDKSYIIYENTFRESKGDAVRKTMRTVYIRAPKDNSRTETDAVLLLYLPESSFNQKNSEIWWYDRFNAERMQGTLYLYEE